MPFTSMSMRHIAVKAVPFGIRRRPPPVQIGHNQTLCVSDCGMGMVVSLLGADSASPSLSHEPLPDLVLSTNSLPMARIGGCLYSHPSPGGRILAISEDTMTSRVVSMDCGWFRSSDSIPVANFTILETGFTVFAVSDSPAGDPTNKDQNYKKNGVVVSDNIAYAISHEPGDEGWYTFSYPQGMASTWIACRRKTSASESVFCPCSLHYAYMGSYRD
ncbi:hypothetical protein KIPB_001529 [Kipferlia bialata]|uniref:Uncharacterized protein n=1 Tax=Kipferlia bialata TaxID=797122 RepID=A0A9K3CP46_9EUKA|nr:hypothetical protein KIPB_001529 [Kipferlia bialata]|eukprot:g1529.t1